MNTSERMWDATYWDGDRREGVGISIVVEDRVVHRVIHSEMDVDKIDLLFVLQRLIERLASLRSGS